MNITHILSEIQNKCPIFRKKFGCQAIKKIDYQQGYRSSLQDKFLKTQENQGENRQLLCNRCLIKNTANAFFGNQSRPGSIKT